MSAKKIAELENRIKQLELKLGIMDKNPDIAIDWNSAPEWANYYYVDKEGHNYWLQNKPTRDGFFHGRSDYFKKINHNKNILVKRPK